MVDLALALPKDFLNPETRCDFYVSRKTKEIWAVEIDLLVQLDTVCKKNNLRYAAAYGTLLGAIRHNGFIPWDDDIDVVMPREDYEQLIELSKTEFVFPYFLECFETDNRYISGFAKLKNSNTTAIENPKSGRNQGMFIDIFPLDCVVDDKHMLNRQLKIINFWNKLLFLVWFCSEDNQKKSDYSLPKRLAGGVFKAAFRLMGKQISLKFAKYCMRKQIESCSKYNKVQTEYMTTLACSNAFLTLNRTEDFNHLQSHDFEFIQIPIEPGYDEVLTKRFGDYHQFVRGGSSHDIILFDTDKSYKEHIKKFKN
jgi:lipopolysaccharide cholinephosphotransferase